MFIRTVAESVSYLETRAKDFGVGCERVYVSLSGGVDSAVVATILARAFGAENVFALYRDIRSNSEHKSDVRKLQKAVGFRLIEIDANPLYDLFLAQCEEQFAKQGLSWISENDEGARAGGWESGYASCKSRFTTPLAAFIAKVIDGGNGRIYGTGNAEEDVLLRYFDKYGDGAVDNNILVGLLKMEVRQIALYFEEVYDAEIFRKIAEKTPSADLQANGDAHNDESELTSWARDMGCDIALSYGDVDKEGNIAWIVKADLDLGVVTGERSSLTREQLVSQMNFSQEQAEVTLFARAVEKRTRHKELGIPGVDRMELRANNFVD